MKVTKKSKKINRLVVTGGGTGGHVFPAIRIANAFKRTGSDVLYIGSIKGIEKELTLKKNIKFVSISTGKLRRYFSFQNFIDPFKILYGFFESVFYLNKFNPDVVFSKGGYVSLPVVFAAWIKKIPIVLHESDITPGLANKLMIPFAKKICLSFKESEKYISSDKKIFTGNPIREEFFKEEKDKGKIVAGFNDKDDHLPTVLILGGSLGATEINNLVEKSLTDLLKFCKVILQCGKGKLMQTPDNLSNKNRFFQVEFVGVKALSNFYNLADIVVSRAGAGQITELSFLQKPSILIPLGRQASRGDQIINAKVLEEKMAAIVIKSGKATKKTFLKTLKSLIENEQLKNKLSKNIKRFYKKGSVKEVVKIVKESKK